MRRFSGSRDRKFFSWVPLAFASSSGFLRTRLEMKSSVKHDATRTEITAFWQKATAIRRRTPLGCFYTLFTIVVPYASLVHSGAPSPGPRRRRKKSAAIPRRSTRSSFHLGVGMGQRSTANDTQTPPRGSNYQNLVFGRILKIRNDLERLFR
jgi:hypothetical protein